MIKGNNIKIIFQKDSHLWLQVVAVMIFVSLIVSLFVPSLAAALDAEKNITIDLEEISSPVTEVYIGQSVKRQFKISAFEDDCYIRLKTDIDVIDGSSVCRYGNPAEQGWMPAKDGWWYYSEPLSAGDAVTFSSCMSIADNFEVRAKSLKNIEFLELTTAEAIDSDALIPNWESDDPWAGLASDPSVSKDYVQLSKDDAESADLSSNTLRNIRLLKELAQTFDTSALFLNTSLIVVVLALCLVVVSIIFGRRRHGDDMSFSEIDPTWCYQTIYLEGMDERKK